MLVFRRKDMLLTYLEIRLVWIALDGKAFFKISQKL
jgi:hypothetical protein